MKLKELNESIASTCNVRAQVVNAVQAETFRQLRAALGKGERVTIPDFGIFMVRDVAGEEGQPGKKVVKFREKSSEGKTKEEKSEKAAKRKAKAESKSEGSADE